MFKVSVHDHSDQPQNYINCHILKSSSGDFQLVAFLTVIAVAGAQTQVNYEIPSGQVALRRGAPTLSTQVLQVIPAPAAQSIRTQFILQAAPASPPQPIAPQLLLRAAPAPAPSKSYGNLMFMMNVNEQPSSFQYFSY